MIKTFRFLTILSSFFISACGSSNFEAKKEAGRQRAQYEAEQKAMLLDAIKWPNSSLIVETEKNESLSFNSLNNVTLFEGNVEKSNDDVDNEEFGNEKNDEGKSEKENSYIKLFVPKWNKSLNVDTKTNFKSTSRGGTSLQDALAFSTEVLEAEAAIFEAIKDKNIIETGLGIQTSGSFQAGSKSLRDNSNGLYTSVTSEKLIADGGFTSNRLLVADKIIDVAYNQYLLTIDKVLLTAATTYTNYEKSTKISNVIARNKMIAMPLLDNLERLKLVGQIDATKVMEAKQIFSNLEIAETEVLSSLNLLEASLMDIFGKKATEIEMDTSNISQLPLDFDYLKVMQNVEQKLAKSNLEVAVEQLNEHTKSKWGAVSGRVVLDVPVSQNNSGADASIGLVFSKTFRDAGRHVQLKKKLEANINRKENFLKTTEDAAAVQILSLLEQLNALNKTQKLKKRMKSDVQMKIDQLNKQLNIGSTEFGELLQSRLELFNLERDLINIETEFTLTKLQVLRATGQLTGVLKVSPALDREEL